MKIALNSKTFAGIITFNPEINCLRENISSINNQIGMIVVVDNGSDNISDIEECCSYYPNVSVVKSEINVGIAAALNIAMQIGKDKNYEWMLTLDQDSISPPDMVFKLFEMTNVIDKIAIVAPIILDRNVGLIGHVPDTYYKEVRTCITSGSLVSINAWELCGKYDEKMFIDSVDFEFCYRLRKNGFKVIQTNNVSLTHEIGASQRKRLLLWHVIINNHSAFRKYYIARNNIYYPKKHKLYLHLIRGNLRNIILLFLVFFYETNKKDKIISILKGYRDGYIIK